MIARMRFVRTSCLPGNASQSFVLLTRSFNFFRSEIFSPIYSQFCSSIDCNWENICWFIKCWKSTEFMVGSDLVTCDLQTVLDWNRLLSSSDSDVCINALKSRLHWLVSKSVCLTCLDEHSLLDLSTFDKNLSSSQTWSSTRNYTASV